MENLPQNEYVRHGLKERRANELLIIEIRLLEFKWRVDEHAYLPVQGSLIRV